MSGAISELPNEASGSEYYSLRFGSIVGYEVKSKYLFLLAQHIEEEDNVVLEIEGPRLTLLGSVLFGFVAHRFMSFTVPSHAS